MLAAPVQSPHTASWPQSVLARLKPPGVDVEWAVQPRTCHQKPLRAPGLGTCMRQSVAVAKGDSEYLHS